jgi:hypothetical protein
MVVGAAQGAVAIDRRDPSARFVVAANAADAEVSLEIALEGVDTGTLRPVALGDGTMTAVAIQGGRARLHLGPRSGVVFAVEIAGS